jgi:hypothetical protein
MHRAPGRRRRRLATTLTCATVRASASTGASAATQQQLDAAVAAATAWVSAQQDPTTGTIGGPFDFGGDWALSALAAAGVHAADLGTPSAQDACLAKLDFLLALQRTSGPNAGSFKWLATEGDDDQPNLHASQDALRTYARGPGARLRILQPLPNGRYTLRIGGGRDVRSVAVTLRRGR